jgi:hypothetical protein
MRAALASGNHPDTAEWRLVKTIGEKNKGVSFNPYLTTEYTAKQWLADRQAQDKKAGLSTHEGWGVVAEDLDTNPETPDDIIVVDSRGNPRIVSGYSINSGKGRRKAAAMYNQFPSRKIAGDVRKFMKINKNTRLFNKYLEDQATHARNQSNYNQGWAQSYLVNHPHDDPTYYTVETNQAPYRRLATIIHGSLKEIPDATHNRYYMELAREIIHDVYELIKKDADTKEGRHAWINRNLQGIRDNAKKAWAVMLPQATAQFKYNTTPYYIDPNGEKNV